MHTHSVKIENDMQKKKIEKEKIFITPFASLWC